MIEIKNVDFRYGMQLILDNISLKVEKGEFIGIIGPNGSGKTTLLRNICRILKPYKGIVVIDNKTEHKPKELARKLAVVSDISPDFNFNVLDTVLMGRAPHLGFLESEKEEDIKIAKRAMGLTNTRCLADKCMDELSSGERQRVLIAQCLTQEPKIILLDEPTSHLDINHSIEILDLINGLNKEKKITVMTILHDLNLAAQYCDRLILLEKGKVFCSGPVEKVITAENIKKAYDIDVNVKKDDVSGKLIIHPFKKRRNAADKSRVHIIGGSGNAIYLMNGLTERGYRVSTGVVNIGDSDYTAAQALELAMVKEKPFSHISSANLEKNICLIKESEHVVLANIPIGLANIKNLEAAGSAKKLIIVEKEPIEERDYTNGMAVKLYNELKKKAVVVSDERSAIEVIEK
ncbi:ABC transporter ATP-binding protein [Candidatus Woesearchaeota archaeon]|nr:ABC transporter ATP-binding protein [Candidatus Woesearchaeota archaeon]